MPASAYKRCTKCGGTQPLEVFCRDRSKPDGRHPHCKQCRSAAGKKWYRENRESHNANSRAWRQDNPAKQRSYTKKWRRSNPDKASANAISWRRDNPERAAEVKRDYERRHPEKTRARAALKYAVSVGNVVKPAACQSCGRQTARNDLHGHHDDYSKPLDVRWLCRRCHGAEHRQS